MMDEPLVTPFSPGAAIVRLSQAKGALERHDALTRTLPPDSVTRLAQARVALLGALEANDSAAIAVAFDAARNELRWLHEAACQPGLWPPDQVPAHFAALGFPDPGQKTLQAINVKSVLATFAKPVRQVLTNLSFDAAPGATSYWLHEVRVLRDEPLTDAIVESTSPLFTRLRLPLGPHTFRIESLNASQNVYSEEFSIIVPTL